MFVIDNMMMSSLNWIDENVVPSSGKYEKVLD